MTEADKTLVELMLSSNEYASGGTTAIMPYLAGIPERDIRKHIEWRKERCIIGKLQPIEPSGRPAMELLASHKAKGSAKHEKAYHFEFVRNTAKGCARSGDGVSVKKRYLAIGLSLVRGMDMHLGENRCDIGFDFLGRAVCIRLSDTGEFAIRVYPDKKGRPISAQLSCRSELEKVRQTVGDTPAVEIVPDRHSAVLTKKEG